MLGLDNPLHIAFLLVLLLLVFGAKRLPEMGKSLGSGLRGFKDSLSGEEDGPTLSGEDGSTVPKTDTAALTEAPRPVAPAPAPAPAAGRQPAPVHAAPEQPAPVHAEPEQPATVHAKPERISAP